MVCLARYDHIVHLQMMKLAFQMMDFEFEMMNFGRCAERWRRHLSVRSANAVLMSEYDLEPPRSIVR